MSAVCTICGEPAGPDNSMLCNGCNNPFHLQLKKDSPIGECGRVWVNEQFMTLEYGCLRCLGELKEAPTRRRYKKVR